MNVIAVNPGLGGAFAILGECGELIELKRPAGDKVKTPNAASTPRLSPTSFANTRRSFAIVEQASAGPGQGVSSAFRFGQAYGTILGVIGALAIPVRHVSPAKWKRALALNSDGETSRARAIETWPAQAELFARKRDHNRAEAALLGLYALKAGRQSADATTIDQMRTQTVLKTQSA